MAQRIIDLDEVLPDPIIVRIGGEEYTLPADLPIPDFHRLDQLVKQVDEAEIGAKGEAIRALYEAVCELFAEHNDLPTDDEGKPVLPLGAAQLGTLVVSLYQGDLEPLDGEGDRPTSRSKSKRSRSSR